MPGNAGQTAGHGEGRDHPHIFRFIDEIRTDEELVCFLMDHSTRGSSPHAFRSDDLPQVRRDFIKLVRRAVGRMGCVSDRPEAASPRNDRPSAAFAFRIEHREAGINSGNLLGGACERA